METKIATNLTKARKSKGLTMDDLAGMVNCSKQAISHYENSLRHPDSKTLLTLAKVLGVNLEYFFNETNVRFNLRNINYREGNFLSNDQRIEVEEIASSRLNDYLELETIAKEYQSFINPLKDFIVHNVNDAEKAAKDLRKKWKLGENHIYSLSSLLENRGVRIIKISFGFNYEHAGLSGWAEENIPVIILNSKQRDVSRVRFTILHELAHLLLSISEGIDQDSIEKICDRFAGAVLLPSDKLLEEFGKNRTAISRPELIRIKGLYGISIPAIMVRAAVIGLISWPSFNKWKQSDVEERDFGSFSGIEEPQRFEKMLYRCLSERRIGYDKAAKLAHKDEDELMQIYNHQYEF